MHHRQQALVMLAAVCHLAQASLVEGPSYTTPLPQNNPLHLAGLGNATRKSLQIKMTCSRDDPGAGPPEANLFAEAASFGRRRARRRLSSDYFNTNATVGSLSAAGSCPAPAWVDLDGDGLLDLVIGTWSGELKYFKAGGSSAGLLSLTEVQGYLPFREMYNSSNASYLLPAFTDLDGDGDADLALGSCDGLAYWENVGNRTAPIFSRRVGESGNPLHRAAQIAFAAPAFVDIDGDQKLDLICGTADGRLEYFRNTGPKFVAVVGTHSPFDNIQKGVYAAPAFTDLDGDGDQDIIVGSYLPFYLPVAKTYLPKVGAVRSRLTFFRNTGTRQTAAFVEENPVASNPFATMQWHESRARPSFADLNFDGRLDVVVGVGTASIASGRHSVSGYLAYYEFRGTKGSPLFRAEPGGPLDGEVVSQATQPGFADLNGDGAPDLVAGNANNHLYYYRNMGTASHPAINYGPSIFSKSFMEALSSFKSLSPTFADLDGDGNIFNINLFLFSTFEKYTVWI